jgi:dipeptidyl aminopeptidase/acylaminoacyl peptidase
MGNMTCPMLVIQGRNDPRVVAAESIDLVEALRKQGKERLAQRYEQMTLQQFAANGGGSLNIRAVSDHPMALYTNNLERMRITATGNVGIGTTNPATLLDVNGDVTITDKIIHSGDTNTAIRFPAADTFAVETAGSERMRIISTGNVGIGVGTTSPVERLAVRSVNVDGVATVANFLNLSNASANTAAEIQLTADQSFAKLRVLRDAGGSTATTVLLSSVSGVETERMRVTSTGNVGIGTTTPQVRLDVESGSIRAGSATVSGTYSVSLRSGGSDSTTLRRYSTGLGEVRHDGGTFQVVVGDANVMSLATDGTERMRIAATGNVGIGTTTPDARLDVEGNVRAGSDNLSGNYSVALRSGGSDSTSLGRYSTGIGEVRHNGGTFQVVVGDANALSLTTDNTERMRITATGNVGINEASADYRLDVNGTFGFTPGASVTPVDNGDVVFELTDNTTLTVKAKGSDGVVRSGTITLA